MQGDWLHCSHTIQLMPAKSMDGGKDNSSHSDFHKLIQVYILKVETEL